MATLTRNLPDTSPDAHISCTGMAWLPNVRLLYVCMNSVWVVQTSAGYSDRTHSDSLSPYMATVMAAPQGPFQSQSCVAYIWIIYRGTIAH